jgi:hypothetical protein
MAAHRLARAESEYPGVKGKKLANPNIRSHLVTTHR